MKLKKKDAVGTVGGPLAENGCGEYGRERQQRRGKRVGHSRICGARLGNRVESRLHDQEEGRENQEEKLRHLSKGASLPRCRLFVRLSLRRLENQARSISSFYSF